MEVETGASAPDQKQNGDNQGTDNDQTGTINWDNFNVSDIPETVIQQLTAQQLKNNSAYSDVLSESISRRKEIKQLKDEMQPPKQGDDSGTDMSNPEIISLQEQLRELTAQVGALSSNQQDTVKEAIASKYKLTTEHQEFLTGSTTEELEAQAKKLATLRGKDFEDDTTSFGSTQTSLDSLKQRIQDRLTGKFDEQGSFDIGLQKRVGGRALVD